MSNAINYNLIYLCLSHTLCVYARVRKVSNWSCKVSQAYMWWQKQKTTHVNWKQTLAVNSKEKKWFNSKENKNNRNDYKLKIQHKEKMKSTNLLCVFYIIQISPPITDGPRLFSIVAEKFLIDNIDSLALCDFFSDE